MKSTTGLGGYGALPRVAGTLWWANDLRVGKAVTLPVPGPLEYLAQSMWRPALVAAIGGSLFGRYPGLRAVIVVVVDWRELCAPCTWDND